MSRRSVWGRPHALSEVARLAVSHGAPTKTALGGDAGGYNHLFKTGGTDASAIASGDAVLGRKAAAPRLKSCLPRLMSLAAFEGGILLVLCPITARRKPGTQMAKRICRRLRTTPFTSPQACSRSIPPSASAVHRAGRLEEQPPLGTSQSAQALRRPFESNRRIQVTVP